MTAKPLLEVNGIEVIYNHVILVLKGVSLTVPEGGIVALLGANGAGKTTTLKAVSNLLAAERGDVTKGTIHFAGVRIDRLNPSEVVKRGVIQVMEGRHCFAHLTVEENLLTGAYTRGAPRSEVRADLERVYGFFPRLKQRRSSLAGYTSGGEQQMTAIGRALMARPKMILLDEPSMGLAPQIVEEIFEIVKNLNAAGNVSFLLAEQNTMVALRFADFGYILENGRVVLEGSAHVLSDNEDVKEFYLGISSGARRSFRETKHYRRRKRWLADMPEHFDALEIRARAERERDLFSRLPAQLAYAKANAPFYREAFASIDVASIASRAALATLPITRKSQLLGLQSRSKPFGGLNATPNSGLARIFASPGPIYDPEGREADYWHAARGLFAAGFLPGDVVLNCFSYHLTPAGSMFETGLHRLGCAVIPGGVGQTELQARVIADVRPTGYVGTPSFLKIILEKADELGLDSSSIHRAQVSGEAFMPAVRAFLAARSIDTFQAYGTAELGIVAYESPARDGLVASEELIVEIVRPGTGDPAGEGEVGEVVVTPFNRDYPLVRFATGDLSAMLAGESACGRTNCRIKGWMGRADQSTKVRGMFVHPHQVAEVLRRHRFARARLVVSHEAGEDRMVLRIETAGPDASSNAPAVEATLRDVLKVRGDVDFVAAGTLPNDGKVIDDTRVYS